MLWLLVSGIVFAWIECNKLSARFRSLHVNVLLTFSHDQLAFFLQDCGSHHFLR